MSGYEGFARYYDDLTANVDYARIADAVESAAVRYRGKKGILLDLACGTGSLSRQLARRGFDVIGTDCSEQMLNAALNQKTEDCPDIQYLCQDMRQLDMFGTIDVTVCVLDSLNHLDSIDDLQKVFERVSLFAEPDGLFIFDVNTLHKHRDILADNAFIFELDGLYCGWQNEYDKTDSSVMIFLDFFEGSGEKYTRYSESFREIYIPQQAVLAAAEKCSFKLIGCFGGYSFEPLDENSERAVYIMQKI